MRGMGTECEFAESWGVVGKISGEEDIDFYFRRVATEVGDIGSRREVGVEFFLSR